MGGEEVPGRVQHSTRDRGVSKQEGFAAHASSSPAAAFLEMGCIFALLPPSPQLLPSLSIIKFYRLYNMS